MEDIEIDDIDTRWLGLDISEIIPHEDTEQA